MDIEHLLRVLATKEQWELDQLPEGVGLEELRVLDVKGYIALKCWIRQNTTKRPQDPDTWSWQPWHVGWRSPIHDGPDYMGDWSRVWNDRRKRDEWHRPPSLKFNDQGLAALAQLPTPKASVSKQAEHGLTKRDIQNATKYLGDTNFLTLLAAAGVSPSSIGGAGSHRVFYPPDIEKMASALESNTGPNGSVRNWRDGKNNAAALRSLLN